MFALERIPTYWFYYSPQCLSSSSTIWQQWHRPHYPLTCTSPGLCASWAWAGFHSKKGLRSENI